MKESVFSKRSLFEQPKQEPVPSPTRRPLLKTTTKKDDKPKRPEERKPVKEPIIVPKHIYPLGDDEDEPAEQPASEPVKEDIKMTSSKLVMSAMATSNQTRTTEVRKESTTYTPYVVDEDRPEESDTLVPLKKDRSPSPFMKESSSAPRSKEGSPTPRSKEGSPVPRSKESSPAPFSKEGSPSRFVTGKPIDSGINSNKIRRIERTGSNKKLLEDLEVSRESLPHYLSTIETIFDVTILENLLEKAESYEERRLIRGQLRLAKRPGAHQTTTPSRPSTTTTRAQPAAPRPTRPVVSEDLSLGDTTRKPLSKSDEPEDAPRQPEEQEEPVPNTTPTTTQPSRKHSRDSYRESSREPTVEDKDPARSPKKYMEEVPERHKQPEEPRKFDRQVKPEEPRRFGRATKPDEPKKVEPTTKTPEPSRFGRIQTEPKKAAPSNEPYSEPLRYQKGQSRTPSKPATEQSDVDKIVSAYGVGPTDENGLPLFGLRALKRRSPPTTCVTTPRGDQPTPAEESKPQEEPRPTSEVDEPNEEVYEPKDSSGRPLFGLRALKKSPPVTTALTTTESAPERATSVVERRDTASSVVESSRLVSSVMSQRATHATEVVSTESPHDSDSLETEEEDQESDSEEDEEALQHYSDEEETSPGLVKNFRDSFKKEPQPTTKVTSRPKDTTTSQSPDDEVIGRRSQPLRDILKLHESKVQEPAVAEESPRLKPKQRLRENFETTSEKQESRVHKTWDMQTDLSTRSLNMKNIIAQHETITSDDTPKPKKLTGILKKTSSSNILSIETRSSVTAETTTDSETKEDVTVKQQLNSTDDILDTLTEDQITRLSEEFDLRAQDDGVIKTEEESMEELSGGYQVTSRKEEDHTDGSKFVRKTSYTEIKLQQPSTEEGSRVVHSSSSATVDQSSGTTFHVTKSGAEHITEDDDTMKEGRSFLDDRTKVTGITDVLSRMGATEAVDHEAKVTSDDQARSLLNRFLGAQVLMSGVESMMASSSLSESSRAVTDGESRTTVTQEASGHTSSTATKDGAVTDHHSASYSTGPHTSTTTLKLQGEPVVVRGVNLSEVTDDTRLNQLLDSCDEYEDRRRIRMRLKTLMAEKKSSAGGAERP
ncbi:cell surface glycoprotein 1-like [Homarus americanus]|uniref:cell surface glycoprotein 1-like n=1 Tax=Homarus americanus TaxID=6706 RepID=UPI001C4746F4|nr:cell surface glycoprotein 1-like [Homarus americanus]